MTAAPYAARVLVAAAGLLAGCSFGGHRGDTGDDAITDAATDAPAGAIDGMPGPDAPLAIDGAALPDAFDPAVNCPGNYFPLPGQSSRYRIHRTADTLWGPARTACDADATSITHLLILDNPAELAAVALATGPEFQWSHIGIHRVAGQLRLVVGGAPSYLPWSAGEPGTTSGKPAGDAVSLDPSDASIFDIPTDWAFGYVCECDGLTTVFD